MKYDFQLAITEINLVQREFDDCTRCPASDITLRYTLPDVTIIKSKQEEELSLLDDSIVVNIDPLETMSFSFKILNPELLAFVKEKDNLKKKLKEIKTSKQLIIEREASKMDSVEIKKINDIIEFFNSNSEEFLALSQEEILIFEENSKSYIFLELEFISPFTQRIESIIRRLSIYEE